MAKRRKREEKIDVNEKRKKNELSLAFMKAYIEAKVDADKLEEAKAEFKANAIENTDDGEKYSAKKAKDYFASKYPDAIEPPKKKGGNTATEDLMGW